MARLDNSSEAATASAPSRVAVWCVAVRSFAYTASVLPIALGTALAWSAGYPLRPAVFALLLAGTLFIHTAGNLLNDCYDFLRGFDRDVVPVSGAVVRGWITPRQARHAAYGCLAAGCACGLALAWLTGPAVLAAGLVGVLAAVGYTRRGRCLKTAGLGDPAVALAFGVLPVCVAWWVQTGAPAWHPVVWSLPLALFAVAILHANNWRDTGSDEAHGCRTVAGRLGPAGALAYYRALILLPFLVTGLLVLLERLTPMPVHAPVTVLVTLLALPPAWRLVIRVGSGGAPARVMLDIATARLHLIFGVLLTAGFLTAWWGVPR